MIDLTKFEERKEKVQLTLNKFNIPEQKVAVEFFIDNSGSMSSMYRKGEVQEVFEKILPIADLLDNDHKMQVYSFNSMCNQVGTADKQNAHEIIHKITPNGGTNYAPIIKAALKGKSSTEPTLAIVITDGDCFDKNETIECIRTASKENVFFQFVGIGHERFKFLEHLDDMEGRTRDNVDFFKVANINAMGEEELYEKLMQEFSHWLKGCDKKKGNLFSRLFGK